MDTDVYATKQLDGPFDFCEVQHVRVDIRLQRDSASAILLPEIQNTQFFTTLIGGRIRWVVPVPLFVEEEDSGVRDGSFDASVETPDLDGMSNASDRTVSKGVIEHHAKGGLPLEPIDRDWRSRQVRSQILPQAKSPTVNFCWVLSEFHLGSVWHEILPLT